MSNPKMFPLLYVMGLFDSICFDSAIQWETEFTMERSQITSDSNISRSNTITRSNDQG